ncbi:MAG: hypothetical protein AMXMBFR64_13590 [Myxococcales bacterium]
MNRSELIDVIATRTNLARKDAEIAVNTVFDSMIAALVDGDRVEIRGFGSFTTRRYDSYTGRNPRTGDAVEVPAKVLPSFRVGKELRERVDSE